MRTIKIALLAVALIFLFLVSYQTFEIENRTSTPPNFKVAFVGDQGTGTNAKAVLQLMKSEGADMVLHQGDFDYEDDPEKWDLQINEVLGKDFPYFASIGNHDIAEWQGYKKKLQERLNRLSGAVCRGELGVKSACTYKGILFILSGAGTMGSRHDSYIHEQLEQNNFAWRICSWHKNQRLMQAGAKQDEVGWGPYEECRKGGAIVATGHEHSYSRTRLMNNFETQEVASTSNTLQIEKGKSFAFVSGLGGHSIRSQDEKLAAKDWFAAIYTTEQNATYGALFCIFNENGVENKARCYFKDVDGNVPDEFNIVSNVK